MPRFAYAAIDASGTSVEGVTKADTLGEARAALLDQNLSPVKIQEKRGALDFELTKEKVKKKELMHFTRQLAVFVKAGIPITEAMEIIGDETQDVALQRTITQMVEDLRNGGTLSEAAGTRKKPPASTRRPSPRTTSASCSRRSSPDGSTIRSRALPAISIVNWRQDRRWCRRCRIQGS